MAVKRNILVIGAGELGHQVLHSLITHQNLGGTVSVLIRPGNLSTTDTTKARYLTSLRESGIHIIPGDITEDDISTLASKFSPYYTVICCAGFSSGLGTQIKITRAVLDAGVRRYIPWQFGVDYDAVGRGVNDLFDEQISVRELLRAQEVTSWVVISTGMFTSFLFESFFGVVDVENDIVRALGSWENRVTLTTAEDIGSMTAEYVLGAEVGTAFPNEVVFLGGDTLSYGQVADLVERVVGRRMSREVIEVGDEEGLGDDGLAKYYGVFGRGIGVSWDLERTWNYQMGIRGKSAEEWARENLV